MPDAPSKPSPPATAAEARARAAAKRTPEQQERYVEVTQRQIVLQEKGVPVPASGTFGGKAREAKK